MVSEHDSYESAAGKSLEDILKEFIPDGSAMALSFKNRKSRVMFMSSSGYLTPYQKVDLDAVNRTRNRGSYPEAHGTLVIEDVNLACYKELSVKYPGVIDPARFAEHIVRFDGLPIPHGNAHTITGRLVTDYPDAKVNVNSSGNFMTIRIQGQYQPEESKNGFHLDTRLESMHGEAQKHIRKLFERWRSYDYRTDVYQRDALSYWRRISTRITCFRLEVGFCKCCRLGATRQYCH